MAHVNARNALYVIAIRGINELHALRSAAIGGSYQRSFHASSIGLMISLLSKASNAENMFRNTPPLDTLEWLPKAKADARLRYAQESPLQYGDLRLPGGEPPPDGYPPVVFIHGGAWRSDFSKDYSSPFVEALTQAGVASWDIEYRRLGNSGGGYPGTFLDVAAGADYLRVLAETYPIDISRAVAVGHSSGGHLALWLAGRKNLEASSALYTADPLALAGVVSLAGVNDLERSLELGNRKDVLELLDVESRQDAGPRFTETNPGRLLPFDLAQVLIVGTLDEEWRIEMTREYAAAARAAGDEVQLELPAGADHFDVIDPEGPVVHMVASSVLTLTEVPPKEIG